jgi:Protein of unknown function (DUF1579)
MGKEAFERSATPGGVHHRLAAMAGDWEGRFRLWFQPGTPAEDSVQRGSIRLVGSGRFLLHEYEGECVGEPFEGVALWAYHLDENAFECAWGESFGTGTSIMFSTGRVEDGRFGALGSYGAGDGSPERWGWRTELSQPDAEHLDIRMFNVTPAGQETLAVEVNYRRAPLSAALD